ncbi:MAG: hypothetical protein ACLQNE_08765 [Thermoguttaceae bacterium]
MSARIDERAGSAAPDVGDTAARPARVPLAACPPVPSPHGQQAARGTRRETGLALVTLGAIIAGGVALRTYGLYGRSIWFDEAMSWRTIGFPVGEMIARVGRNIHVPLHYLLLKSWTAVFGESLPALRSMNLVLAAAAMAGLYLWATEAFRPAKQLSAGIVAGTRRVPSANYGTLRVPSANYGTRRVPTTLRGAARGRWIGLTTAALYAVSLYQVRLAWEIRMYTLGTALVALSSWLLFRALAAQTQHYRAWAAYGLVALAFVYTHHFAWFSIFGQAVFVAGFALAKSRGRVLAALKGPYVRHALAAYSIVALGWAPWLPTFLHQERQVLDDWWSLPVSLRDVTWVCYNMFFNTELDGLKEGPAAIVACACAVLLLWLLVKVRVGAWYFACRLAAKGRLGEWYVLAATVLPFSAVCFVSVVGRNVVVSRYFAFVQPFVLAAIAVLLSRIPDRPLRNWVAAMLVVTALGVHLDFVDSLEIDKKPGARAAAAYIDAQRREDEPVIACSGLLYFPMLYHARDRDGWFFYGEKELAHYLGGPAATAGERIDRRGMDAIRAKRAWVVTTSGVWGRREMYIPATWREQREEVFPEVLPFQKDMIVEVYEVPPGGRSQSRLEHEGRQR